MVDEREIKDGGTLYYDASFLDSESADILFTKLREETPWQQIGRFPRLVAFYADDGVAYTYSRVTHRGSGWPPYLAEVKQRVEDASRTEFNSLLLNFYRGAQDSIGWHADNEKDLGVNPVVASVSLGAVRDFLLRHNETRERITLPLSHGSLLVMGGTCQHHWQHSVPKVDDAVDERINLI